MAGLMGRGLGVVWCVCLVLVFGLTGCGIPQVSAEDRLFLDLSVGW